MAVWNSYGQDGSGAGVYQQRFAPDGTRLGGKARQFSDATLGDQSDASMAVDSQGNFVVSRTSTDRDGSGLAVVARRYSDYTVTGYDYDAAGNRNTAGYATETGNRMTADGMYAYQYDDEGNLTRKTKTSDGTYWAYGYDNADRMTSARHYTAAVALDHEVDYAYDA